MNKTRIARLGLLLALPLKVLAEPVYNSTVVNLNASAPPAASEAAPDGVEDPHQRGLSFGGPRFGISYLSGSGFDKMKDTVKKAKPDVELEQGMTQFGWQIEYRMFRTTSGVTALTELIPLVGGMDLGLALPSATWLVGLRSKNGYEVGVGPNFGLDGVAMMIATGHTFDLGGINVPLNVAFGKGANQTNTFALSTGFNL
jgi:hypothetical protein